MDAYEKINQVPCRVKTWGSPFSCDGRDVILCITGNPGIIDFYFDFSSILHQRTGLPLCLIGQAGHELIPGEKAMELKGSEHLFDLDAQIDHKLDLINNFIDKQSKLHLIGHSIGAWLIIECIQKHPSLTQRVSSINLLFPTLQGMAVTRNGKYVNNILRKFKTLIVYFLILLNLLPNCVLKFLANIYLKFHDLPEHYLKGVLKHIDPNIIEKVLFLAFCEMDQVININTETITRVQNHVNVIYGEDDGWVPLEYIEEWKQSLPTLKMTKVPISHAFVLKSSERIAEMVSEFINRKSSNFE